MYKHLVWLAAIFALDAVPLNSMPPSPTRQAPSPARQAPNPALPFYRLPQAVAKTTPSVVKKTAPRTATKVAAKTTSNLTTRNSRTLTLHFRQTGGLEKTCRGVMMHADVLPHGQDQELRRLVDQSGIMNIYSLRHVNARSLDAFHYNIAIVEDGVVTHDATFDDLTIPPSYKPLLAFLSMHSRPIGRLF